MKYQRRKTRERFGSDDTGQFANRNHIKIVIGDAYRRLRNIRTSFNCIGKYMMRKIFTTVIRPLCRVPIHEKAHQEKTGKNTKIAAKLVPELKELIYEKRLKEMQIDR